MNKPIETNVIDFSSPLASTKPIAFTSPTDVVARWRTEGPLVRVPSGIAPLDELCRGGFPLPWRVVIVGAPSAGKTAVQTIIANSLAHNAVRAAMCVGILAVDEDPDDVTVRLAQIAGFTIAQSELRASETLDAMVIAFENLAIRFYGAGVTIEEAGLDLATWAASEQKRAALFIDSIQTVESIGGKTAESARAIIKENVKAMRGVATTYRMLVVATSEANRAAYRGGDSERPNDMAAGSESSAIEYGAQTLIMLRTPEGHPNIVHANVAKNRRAKPGEFYLELDRDRHQLTPVGNPARDPATTEQREANARAANMAKLEAQAKKLLDCLAEGQTYSTNGAQAAARTKGVPIGNSTLCSVLSRAQTGVAGKRLVNRKAPGATTDAWTVETFDQPPDRRLPHEQD